MATYGMSAKDRLALFQNKGDSSNGKPAKPPPKKIGKLNIGGAAAKDKDKTPAVKKKPAAKKTAPKANGDKAEKVEKKEEKKTEEKKATEEPKETAVKEEKTDVKEEKKEAKTDKKAGDKEAPTQKTEQKKESESKAKNDTKEKPANMEKSKNTSSGEPEKQQVEEKPAEAKATPKKDEAGKANEAKPTTTKEDSGKVAEPKKSNNDVKAQKEKETAKETPNKSAVSKEETIKPVDEKPKESQKEPAKKEVSKTEETTKPAEKNAASTTTKEQKAEPVDEKKVDGTAKKEEPTKIVEKKNETATKKGEPVKLADSKTDGTVKEKISTEATTATAAEKQADDKLKTEEGTKPPVKPQEKPSDTPKQSEAKPTEPAKPAKTTIKPEEKTAATEAKNTVTVDTKGVDKSPKQGEAAQQEKRTETKAEQPKVALAVAAEVSIEETAVAEMVEEQVEELNVDLTDQDKLESKPGETPCENPAKPKSEPLITEQSTNAPTPDKSIETNIESKPEATLAENDNNSAFQDLSNNNASENNEGNVNDMRQTHNKTNDMRNDHDEPNSSINNTDTTTNTNSECKVEDVTKTANDASPSTDISASESVSEKAGDTTQLDAEVAVKNESVEKCADKEKKIAKTDEKEQASEMISKSESTPLNVAKQDDVVKEMCAEKQKEDVPSEVEAVKQESDVYKEPLADDKTSTDDHTKIPDTSPANDKPKNDNANTTFDISSKPIPAHTEPRDVISTPQQNTPDDVKTSSNDTTNQSVPNNETAAQPETQPSAAAESTDDEVKEIMKPKEPLKQEALKEETEVIMSKTFTESIKPRLEFKPVPEEFYNTLFYFSGMGNVIGSALAEGVYVPEHTAKRAPSPGAVEEIMKNQKIPDKGEEMVKSARSQAIDVTLELKHLQSLLGALPVYSDGPRAHAPKEAPKIDKAIIAHTQITDELDQHFRSAAPQRRPQGSSQMNGNVAHPGMLLAKQAEPYVPAAMNQNRPAQTRQTYNPPPPPAIVPAAPRAPPPPKAPAPAAVPLAPPMPPAPTASQVAETVIDKASSRGVYSQPPEQPRPKPAPQPEIELNADIPKGTGGARPFGVHTGQPEVPLGSTPWQGRYGNKKTSLNQVPSSYNQQPRKTLDGTGLKSWQKSHLRAAEARGQITFVDGPCYDRNLDEQAISEDIRSLAPFLTSTKTFHQDRGSFAKRTPVASSAFKPVAQADSDLPYCDL